MRYRILTEASGCLTAGYIIKAIKEAGFYAVASDIIEEIALGYVADEYLKVPVSNHPDHWTILERLIKSNNIQIVIPTFDETLLGWSERREFYKMSSVNILISSSEVIKKCQDKWELYQIFKSNNIPTPETSLDQKYSLLKPRKGRGSCGVRLLNEGEELCMAGMMTQEFIKGKEYTIDVFCDRNHVPVYIVPRIRLRVLDGKSLSGIVVRHKVIENYVREVCRIFSFEGMLNIQCFEDESKNIFFTEINPRLGGGSALTFAASENWIKLAVDHFVDGKQITAKSIKYGMKMFRYYDEVFVFKN